MALGEPSPETVAATRELESVESAMVRMADALKRVLAAPSKAGTSAVATAFDDQRPLRESLDEVIRSMTSIATPIGATLRVECSADAASLPTGPLEPLFRNAIRNALEAFPAGTPSPEVSVSLRCRGGRLAIDILDNGQGLTLNPPTNATHGEASTKGGFGLGLHVAREVVASLGGTFAISNVPFGPGALVCAEIPIDALRPAADRANARAA